MRWVVVRFESVINESGVGSNYRVIFCLHLSRSVGQLLAGSAGH